MIGESPGERPVLEASTKRLSDGTAYDVNQPELAIVSQQRVDIGLRPDPDCMVARVQFCSLLHVVRVEVFKPA